jgi:ABC-type Mn2+/Zn2+ transport system permease subunit
LISIIIAILSVIGGIVTSYLMNLAPGGTIVIISVAGYLVTIIAKYMFNQIKGKDIKLRLEKIRSISPN